MTLREQYIHADIEGAPITSRGTFTCILSWILRLRRPVKIRPAISDPYVTFEFKDTELTIQPPYLSISVYRRFHLQAP